MIPVIQKMNKKEREVLSMIYMDMVQNGFTPINRRAFRDVIRGNMNSPWIVLMRAGVET
jgi:hypothetical protein